MKIGDLVRLKGIGHIGVLVAIEGGMFGIMWDFLDGQIGWNHSWLIEVVDESR